MAGCLCVRQKTDNVYSLDYRHSNLDYIPSDVFRHERTLEELCVDANQIKELPRELFCCHELKRLSLADNEVRTIPPAISSLEHLEELDVSKNGVISFPENIKHCKNMRRIEGSVNPLGKLPEGITQLPHLTELYLNDAFLDFLPGSFGRLNKLKILEIRENHLKTLPHSMTHMTLLQRLDIGNNDFTELPDVLGSLSCLLELWCDSNQLKSIPPVIGNLRQLIFLDASKNRIETIAAEIEGCLALGDLHLSTNMLQQLPETLGRLSNLTTLKIDDNRLNSLPFSIGGLVSLSELNVTSNDLEEIPPSIGLLRHLRTFYADENFIMAIPPELGSCNGLTVLSLRSNNLSMIPDEIGRIPRLRVLNLSDNKIHHLPYSLTRLKELQALWLSENQTKPLIRLQSELNEDTGQRMLTCYLLPQQPTDDKDDVNSESGSFHPSIWEEERAQRQQIHFDTVEEEDEEGKLRRQPTPYPKEMKHRIQHMRNLALKELNVPNTETTKVPGTSRQSTTPGEKVVGRRDSPQKANTGTSTSKVSPMADRRHHLHQANKDMIQRDKTVIHKSSEGQVHVSRTSGDDGGFLEGIRRRGSGASQLSVTLPRSVSLDRNVAITLPATGPDSKSAPDIVAPDGHGVHHTGSRTASVSYNDFLRGLAARGIPVSDGVAPRSARSLPGHTSSRSSHNYHPLPRRRGNMSGGYESDTGYKSDYGYRMEHSGYLSDTGYRSDTNYRRSASHSKYRHSGYSSDGESRRTRKEGRHGNDYQQSYSPAASKNHSWSQNSHSYGSGRPGEMHHRSLRPHRQSYSNAPMSGRTTIRNDEMYEQSGQRSGVVRSQSAGDDLAFHTNGHHYDSLHRQNRSRSELNASDGQQARSHSYETILEERPHQGRREHQTVTDGMHSARNNSITDTEQSYRHSDRTVATVYTAGDGSLRVTEDTLTQESVQIDRSNNPAYQPHPSYTTVHNTSQQSVPSDRLEPCTPRENRPSSLPLRGEATRSLHVQQPPKKKKVPTATLR